MSDLPLQSSCDPTDPSEHFLWALVGLAGPRNAPLILPPDIMRQWSKHLWECGFRHNPELQEIKFIPPVGVNVNWVQGVTGDWVDINTPLTPEQSAPDISHLSEGEKQVLLRRLQAEMGE